MNEYRKQDLWILFKENKEVTITFVSEHYDWMVDKTIQTQEDLTYFNFDEAVNDIEIRSNSEQIYF
jgi:hypothetical protein